MNCYLQHVLGKLIRGTEKGFLDWLSKRCDVMVRKVMNELGIEQV